jgi:hypothetical protein
MELTGVTFGGGLPLTAALKVEGSLGWHARMTSDDSLNVSFGHFQTHSTDQDVPLVGAVRWSLPCAGRVCADVVGGAGINFHLVTGRTIRSCPAPGGFPPCAESDQTYEINHAEFLLTGGVDFNLQLKGRFAMTPGFRVGLPARRAVPPILPKLGGTEVAPYYLLNINALYRF